MKVIDLLNKIANGEEVPEKIKFENYIYIWRDTQKDYFCEQINHSLESIIGEYLFNNLNLEVEIIEEEKKIPEKLETYKEIDDEDYYANILKVSKNGECEIDEATSVIVDKINEIIDYLKSKGE